MKHLSEAADALERILPDIRDADMQVTLAHEIYSYRLQASRLSRHLSGPSMQRE